LISLANDRFRNTAEQALGGHYAQCPFMHSGFAASGMRRGFEAFFPLAGFA
jgi:hypothetical protein